MSAKREAMVSAEVPPTEANPPAVIKPGWQSSEFWASMAVAAVAIIGSLVGFGLVQPEDKEMLTQNITSIIGSLGSLVIAAGTVYGYLSKRTAHKTAAIHAVMQMKVAERAEPATVKMDISQEKK